MPDREMVMNWLNELAEPDWKSFHSISEVQIVAQDALELLKEQEAKTGYWVSVNDGDIVAIDDDGFPERACFCSECKKYLIASDEYAVYGKYCPFCGAKMEGR